jgi:hypothetical protein
LGISNTKDAYLPREKHKAGQACGLVFWDMNVAKIQVEIDYLLGKGARKQRRAPTLTKIASSVMKLAVRFDQGY